MAKQSDMWWIYALVDPLEPEHIRYVGKTEKSIVQRLGEHIRDATRYNRAPDAPRNRWIKKLFAKERLPVLRQLESGIGIHPYDWIVAEQAWIAYYRFMGHILLNVTIGGEGSSGAKFSAEVRARMSARQRGAKRSPGSGANIRAGQQASARWNSDEFQGWLRSNIKNLQSARLTPEARANNSKSKTGKRASEETRAKMSAARKGKPFSGVGTVTSPLPKLTDSAVREIRVRYSRGDIPMHKLASEFGVTTNIIHRALKGQTYSRVKELESDTLPRIMPPAIEGRKSPEVIEKIRNGQWWAKLDMAKAREIRKLRDEEGLTMIQLGERFGVSDASINSILKGRTYPDGYDPLSNATRTKLDLAKAREIRARYASGNVTQAQLAKEYGVSQESIRCILIGRYYKEEYGKFYGRP